MLHLEYLKECVNTIIKPSKTHGVGFFAVRDIKKGEPIFIPWYGEDGFYAITHDELFTLPISLQEHIRGIFYNQYFYKDSDGNQSLKKDYTKIFIRLTKGYYWQFIYPEMFINSGLQNSNVDTEHSFPAIATRDIKQNEELLANYGKRFQRNRKDLI
jgi:hypothetical protein